MTLPIRESGILSAADLAARMLGLLFLSRFLTEMGLGASASFRILLPIIGVAASFGSIGVPQALTRVFAAGQGTRRTAWWSTAAASLVSVAGLGGLTWIAVGHYGQGAAGPGTDGILRVALAAVPLLVLTCLNGSLRGILFGLGFTLAPALAQVVEIGSRLWVLTALWPLVKNELHATGAQIGIYVLTTGEAAAAVFLGIALWTAVRKKRRDSAGSSQESTIKKSRRDRKFSSQSSAGKKQPRDRVFSSRESARVRTVLRMACAPAGQALLASLGYALELPFAEAWIAQTHGVDTAKHLIADYSAVALPLLCAPMVLTDSLATALLPSESAVGVSARRAAQQLRSVIRAVVLVALPAAAAFVVLAPALTRAFGSSTAADLLVKIAPFALPLYLQAPLSSLLQAHGRSRALLVAGTLGDGARLGALYWGIHSLHLTRAALPLAFAASVCVQTGMLYLATRNLTTKRISNKRESIRRSTKKVL
ncbi:oligosaccharide flippase family protein [Tumebacillus flagellatus]|uniref:Polysaccharide biosynthesis protein C-terminal domain-containing protein n=1 Tax=Tumebacillus flagellatus TaxID=1157490 RepID=A0A074LUH7_9BACL|nr:oligosaccharide flippase family protein [Tumebacillus flagellatus]KEO83588.1 hypothetical protein EL26_09250 [Tumebacillus flagellatus]